MTLPLTLLSSPVSGSVSFMYLFASRYLESHSYLEENKCIRNSYHTLGYNMVTIPPQIVNVVLDDYMRSKTLLVSDFHPSNISFKFSRSEDGWSRKVYLNKSTSNRSSVRLQLCETDPDALLKAPFGVSDPMVGCMDTGRCTVDLTVDNEHLEAKMRELNERCIEYVHTNCYDCFGEQLSLEEVKERFVSPYREVEGKSKLLRIKVPFDRCEILCINEYDRETGAIQCTRETIGIVEKWSLLIPVVTISPIWFFDSEDKFGYSLVATNIIVDMSKHFYKTGHAYYKSQNFNKRGLPIFMKDLKPLENTFTVNLRGKMRKKG